MKNELFLCNLNTVNNPSEKKLFQNIFQFCSDNSGLHFCNLVLIILVCIFAVLFWSFLFALEAPSSSLSSFWRFGTWPARRTSFTGERSSSGCQRPFGCTRPRIGYRYRFRKTSKATKRLSRNSAAWNTSEQEESLIENHNILLITIKNIWFW